MKYFVTAFLGVDYTFNPQTIEELRKTGNLFNTLPEAVNARNEIKKLLQTINNKTL